MGSDMTAAAEKVVYIFGLVNTYSKTITLEGFSVVMTQLLGINLGLTYDDIYNCNCPGTTYIMNSKAISTSEVSSTSSNSNSSSDSNQS
ncbi:disintegrin and metalloproteinase domain-containing protein 18-like [Macaca nemestrina]|uniref:disintegrin and metalloproteinase domain-containing protein 18-like n=1 Tax=Macaca nemestrina TaxID=9545 RepID=UPI0039B8BB59